jgi:NAD-dependent deacetylase
MNLISQDLRKDIIRNFKQGNVVSLTGAGISSESGIPTFRGKGGLWEKYDPQIYANAEGLASLLKEEPWDLINFVVDFYSILLKAKPNPAHIALTVLEKEGMLTSVITQNIDNLHTYAGSRNIIELHGNAYRIRCAGCNKKITLERERTEEFIRLLKINRDSYFKILKILSRYLPRCNCGSRFRLDIVLFGEELPRQEISRAYAQLNKCNLLLLIGTSLLVYPAANLPLYAKERGAKILEINSEPSALSGICDYQIVGKASIVLPKLLEELDN